ncbi:hypothetical protein L7F22_006103 [Adiantum nelumboides]|nr:hypothetical protein [Adiantum nelumboides]
MMLEPPGLTHPLFYVLVSPKAGNVWIHEREHNSMDIQKAVKMYAQYHTWRTNFVPLGGMPAKQMLSELNANTCSLEGHTKKGHPLVIGVGCKNYASKNNLDTFRSEHLVVYLSSSLMQSFYQRGQHFHRRIWRPFAVELQDTLCIYLTKISQEIAAVQAACVSQVIRCIVTLCNSDCLVIAAVPEACVLQVECGAYVSQ